MPTNPEEKAVAAAVDAADADPIADATADLVPHDGSVADLRKRLQTLTAALLERKEYKKNQNKAISEQIKETEAMIKDVTVQLEGLEKTL